MAKLIEMGNGEINDPRLHRDPPPEPILQSFGLTPLQQGMVYHHLRAPGSGVDIEQVVMRLREPVDVGSLKRAWQGLIDRHGVFRTRFVWENVGTPTQIEHATAELPWQQFDLSDLGVGGQEREIAEYLRLDRQRGFAMDRAPLTRAALFQL